MSLAEEAPDVLPYLKLFTEARNDAKLRMLTDAQFRVWFNLLCYAAEQDVRGTIQGRTAYQIAVEVSAANVPLLTDTLLALVALGCVDLTAGNGCNDHVTTGNDGVTTDVTAVENVTKNALRIAFSSFEKRQGRMPSEQPERVRDRVAKHRKERSYETCNGCNDHVTSGNDGVTGCNGLDVDVEEELINTPPLVVPPSRSRPQTKKSAAPQLRDPADLAEVNAAIELLLGDIDTEHLGAQLGRVHGTSGNLPIEGWRWLRAAKRIGEPDIDAAKRRSFPYFAGIAKGYGDDERVERPPPKRESPYQRKQRELKEGFAAWAARDKAEAEAEAAAEAQHENG